jgi:DNA-binding SARP family transcriptional activator
MLAAMAVRAGQVLPAELLIEAMWGAATPRTAPHALQVHASTLRKLVPNDLPIVGRPGGYVLQVGPGQLDTDRFEDLAARGRAELSSGHGEAAAALLRDALGLWRGPALADVPWERFADSDTRRWEELRQATREDLSDAELGAGRHAEVVGDLETLVREEPFRERRWGQLMVALYRCGRQADALDRYRQVRALLAEELGVDPSPYLRELQRQILRQDDSLGPAAAGTSCR